LFLGLLQRRDGRRNTTAPVAGCSANGSSYSACRDLEPHFSCSFIYVRLAVHRNPGANLWPYCSCENSQVWRPSAGEASCATNRRWGPMQSAQWQALRSALARSRVLSKVLTGLVLAALFLVPLFFSRLIAMIGAYPPITAPALTIVGAMMMQNVAKIRLEGLHRIDPGIPDHRCHSVFVLNCRWSGAWVHQLCRRERI
jgi:hypothetical protein